MLTRYVIASACVVLSVAACSDAGSGGQANTAGSGAVAGSSGTAGSASGVGTGGASTAGSGSGGSASGASGAAGTGGAGGSTGGAGGSAGQATSGAGGSGGSGGTASGAGGMGGTGGSGGAPNAPVKPVLRNGQWAFDLGDVTLQVDPMVGGRITTFKLGDENLLTGPTVNPQYWGSTLWTSPETQWAQPPPGPIDSDPFEAVATATTLTLTGMPYPALGVSVTKVFSVDTALGGFVLEYKLTNTKQTAIQMAPWEVTRVLPRGVTFFPKGPTMSLSTGATLPTTEAGGIVWYTYDMNAVTKDSKLYADATEGWVAHAAAGLVFIKSFGDVTADKIAPKEGDVELYTNLLHTYVEIEDQGAYGSIAPGASVSWKVTWFLRKLPVGVDATAGSAQLAQFVRDTIAGK